FLDSLPAAVLVSVSPGVGGTIAGADLRAACAEQMASVRHRALTWGGVRPHPRAYPRQPDRGVGADTAEPCPLPQWLGQGREEAREDGAAGTGALPRAARSGIASGEPRLQ